MNKFRFNFSIWLFIILCITHFSPCFAGHEDGADDPMGGDSIIPIANFVPLFMPDIDQHKGRGIVQQPPVNLPPMPVLPIAPPILQVPIGKPTQQGPLAMPKGQNQQFDGGINPGSPIDDAANHSSTGDFDDRDHDDFDLSASTDSLDSTPAPLFFPDGDQHKGRGGVQEPSNETPKRTFPHRLEEPRIDEKHGRQVITLEGGSPDNPYQVCDHGLFYLGALIGISFVEPHSMVQFNAMSKWKLTTSNASARRAKNYDEGIRRKGAKLPKKVKHFDEWETGDWVRRNGSFSVAFYVGVSYFAPDARVGVVSEVVKSVHYQKLSPEHIRVSITKEFGGGVIARAQALPFQKIEAKDIGSRERSYVYLFDLTKEDERKALDDLVRRNVLFAGSEAYHAAKEDHATLLTSRLIKRHRSTFTPVQIGVPLLARARMTWHVDRYRTAITTHRGETKYHFTAKAHYKQKTYRHKNFKKNRGSHKGKKWRHYMDKHQSYNRGYQGGVVKPVIRKEPDEQLKQILKAGGVKQLPELTQAPIVAEPAKVRPRYQRYIQMQLSFTNDRVQAKLVNSYLKKFLRKVGVNDYMVDVGYRKKAMIGYAELRWDLRVGPNAVNQIARDAVQDKFLFKQTANELIDNYFSKHDGIKNDPHNICRAFYTNTKLCTKMVRVKTHRALRAISNKLRALEKEKIAKSSKKSAELLSDIAKLLSTNQFVLHTFILKLPKNIDGYGRLQIFGERFLGREFNTDPGQNMRQVNSFTTPWTDVPEAEGQDEENAYLNDYDNVDEDSEASVIEDDLEIDWSRLNRGDDMNEF